MRKPRVKSLRLFIYVCMVQYIIPPTMDFNTLLSQLPGAAEKRLALRISQAAERALRQGHPWVFDQSITEQNHTGAPGDLADP